MSTTERTRNEVRRIIWIELGGGLHGFNHPNVMPWETSLAGGLGCDSLDQVEVALALEEEFDIDISDDDWLPALNGTVGDVADLIEGLTDG